MDDRRRPGRVRGAALVLVLVSSVVACSTVERARPPAGWTAVHEVCAPVFVDLIPAAAAGGAEAYYIDVDGLDASEPYRAHVIELARAALRSVNIKSRSQLAPDQAAEPRVAAVTLSCGKATWETPARVHLSGGAVLAPAPGAAATPRAYRREFTLERREGGWVIVRRGALSLS